MRSLRAKARKGVEVRHLRDWERQPGLKLHQAGNVPAAHERAHEALRVKQLAGSDGQFIREAVDKHVRDVAGRNVFFQSALKAVGHGIVADWPGQNRCVKNLPGVIDQLRARIRNKKG